ncbi:MAG: ribonuclease H-like domain-containing protein [Paludibacteraceae bacterium]|nr:ribonuclease H-like domain-containing protein [Paludibacteraceae bacterium]
MNLTLKKPIIFFDLETTGVDIVKDRIVELGYIKVFPNGEEESKTMRFNPERHIPEEATAVHHITDADVAQCPTFKERAKELAKVFEGCDLGGYNSLKFDLPLLAEEFARTDVDIDLKKAKMVDVQNIFYKMEPRTLVAAYKFYCGKNLDDAHAADADIRATYDVLRSQLDKYPSDLQNDINFLSDFSAHSKFADFAGHIIYDESGAEVFNFGKYKGITVEAVYKKDPGYFGWLLQADFPLYTKKLLTEIKLRATSF